ncbi:MAG: transglutaminase-like domain-containing protein [Bacteroidota bacterium]|nr:transglutaminase-like domain-containing protein [Bacteroidota bacterium]
MKNLLLLSLGLTVLICTGFQSQSPVNTKPVSQMIKAGKFTEAESLIKSLAKKSNLSASSVRQLDSLKDQIHRIRRDFTLTELQVREQLSKYYPNLTEGQLSAWEKSKKLEVRLIDNQKRYFSSAVSNLFLLDKEAQKVREQKDGSSVDSLTIFKISHTSSIVKETQYPGQLTEPREMILNFTLTVKPDVVRAGQTIRCWLPFPREDMPRQTDVQMLGCNHSKYIIAPKDIAQRTIYMEQTAQTGQPAIFNVRFKIKSHAQYFNLDPKDIKPYDTTSELYRTNTSERAPQIVFSKRIRDLSNAIVGEEKNPLIKTQKIYTWINDHITWASALEYSIVPCIPEYVLDNKHGDCGMQTLLFMTMARYQGIPARWQTGWMLHPTGISLHDWSEVYFEGIGWVPLDQSFNLQDSNIPAVHNFYITGIDSYRLIINKDYGQKLYPPKTFPRSEPVDFQRGEVEGPEGNLYFDKWSWKMNIEYLNSKN